MRGRKEVFHAANCSIAEICRSLFPAKHEIQLGRTRHRQWEKEDGIDHAIDKRGSGETRCDDSDYPHGEQGPVTETPDGQEDITPNPFNHREAGLLVQLLADLRAVS
jgi:hypothetical protein